MTRDVEIVALRVLVAVADYGSLTAAADVLGMAQPNASRSLAALERNLGLQLIRRTRRGSVPTAEGTIVVEWAREVLAALDSFGENVAALAKSTASHEIVVAASQTIAENLLPGWLARLRVDHPGATVHLQVHNSARVLAALAAGEADLGFVEGITPPGTLNAVTVAVDELVLVVEPDHPWAKRTQVNGEELIDATLITREPGSGTRSALEQALGRPVTPALELGSNTAVRTAVLSGAGPAVLSRIAVADQLAAGRLVAVPLALGRLRRLLQAVWPGPRRLTGVSRELVAIAETATTR